MNAVLQPAAPPRISALTLADLDAVLAVEALAYPFPWSRGNFIDSLAAGHHGWVLRDPATTELLGYCVAMNGVQEMHVLNLTVAPRHQGCGHARRLLARLCTAGRDAGAHWLWLEVRRSNLHAQAVYRHWQFDSIGERRGYYPAAQGQREDALVMRLPLGAAGDGDALD